MLSTEYRAGIDIKDIIGVFLRGEPLKTLHIPPRAEFTRWEMDDENGIVFVYFQLEWKPYYRGEFEHPMPWYIYEENE